MPTNWFASSPMLQRVDPGKRYRHAKGSGVADLKVNRNSEYGHVAQPRYAHHKVITQLLI
jgi:hypothetical protein